MYALIQNGTLVQVGALPATWRDANGEYHDWRTQPYRTQPEDHGWLSVVREPRPADTATTTWEQQPVALIEGVPTIRYVERAKTPEELAAEAEAVTETDIGNKIETVDMPAMQAILAQTNADLRADPSQEMKDMARAIRRLDRKVMALLDGSE